MHVVELERSDKLPLFCPVTGEQMLFEDDFKPSKATVFWYLEDFEVFEHADQWTVKNFLNGQTKEQLDLPSIDFYGILKKMKGDRTSDNLLCFSITNPGHGGAFVFHVCIDMSHQGN
ncbi:hypothetical protein [Gilvibacter sp.]|uniref:hypothetical protein n=1 Tax=Gilvibacter sp. TaxID=2729997 RepID=UPI003B51DF63